MAILSIWYQYSYESPLAKNATRTACLKTTTVRPLRPHGMWLWTAERKYECLVPNHFQDERHVPITQCLREHWDNDKFDTFSILTSWSVTIADASEFASSKYTAHVIYALSFIGVNFESLPLSEICHVKIEDNFGVIKMSSQNSEFLICTLSNI